MTDTPRHSVNVAGIVVNNADQVLVVKRRDNGHWEPPGGVLELNEQFEEGVRRECHRVTRVAQSPLPNDERRCAYVLPVD